MKRKNGIILLIFLVTVLSTFQGISFANTEEQLKGRVFILSDPNIGKLGGDMAASNPERLAKLLSDGGFETKLISAKQMANNLEVNRKNCDLIILPYGPYFPSITSDNFIAFVHRGGKFISMGGYTFAEQIGLDYKPDEQAIPLSSRQGHALDHLALEYWQFPIFDWDYDLLYALAAEPASGQYLFKGDLGIKSELKGWSTCGLIGDNKARWRPLVNSIDRYGHLRGSIGAITHVFPDSRPGEIFEGREFYDRPFKSEGYVGFESTSDFINDIFQAYRGSSWAYFGVTNIDLFDGSYPAMDKGLVGLVEFLIKDVYLKHAKTSLTSYHQGETVVLKTGVCNGGREKAIGKVVFEIKGTDFICEKPFEVKPGNVTYLEAKWAPGHFDEDYYEFSVTLIHDENETTDLIRQGFTVWNPEYIKNACDIVYKDNYFEFNGKNVFVSGTDVAWRMFGGLNFEMPIRWWEDAEKRQDNGINVLECLQQSGRREKLYFLRQIESTIQILRKYNQIYMMGLLIGANVAATDGEMTYEASWVERVAQRYKDCPNIIYYLNGDLRVQLTPELKPVWNKFLKERYSGDINKLKQAWGELAPKENFGDIPCEDYPFMGNGDWTDCKAADYNLFRTYMIRRWCDNLINAIRKYDNKPIVCEFYSWPAEFVDVIWGNGNLTFSNIGYFSPWEQFPEYLVNSDQRARGKSFGVGEYGKRIHRTFQKNTSSIHAASDKEYQKNYYLNIMHYAYALGANHVYNWCWNDSDWTYFPWGFNHLSDYVARDLLYWTRNCNLFFRQGEPAWKAPEIAFLTPDNNRLSATKQGYKMHFSAVNGLKILLSARPGEMCTLNEVDLQIPDSVKVIFYPIPYLPPQNVLKQLEMFVNKGGTLYISGDISYDPLTRKRNRTEWLKKLCGVEFVSENYPNTAIHGNPESYFFSDMSLERKGHPCINIKLSGAKVLWQTKKGKPVVVCNKLGKGNVVFCTDPIELHNQATLEENANLYKSVMLLAHVKPVDVTPYNPNIHAIKLSLADGGKFYCFINQDKSTQSQTITLNEVTPSISIEVKTARPAALWFDGKGNLCGAETQGKLKIDDEIIYEDGTNGIVFTTDNKSLKDAQEYVFLPFESGTLKLFELSTEAKVEIGEIKNSKWLGLENFSPDVNDKTVCIDVDPLLTTKILLISKSGNTAAIGAKVQRMMTSPGLK
jgi:hypothetical protein